MAGMTMAVSTFQNFAGPAGGAPATEPAAESTPLERGEEEQIFTALIYLEMQQQPPSIVRVLLVRQPPRRFMRRHDFALA